MFCEGIYIERRGSFLGGIEATPIVDGQEFPFNTMMDAFNFCKAVAKQGKEKAQEIYKAIKEGK